MPDNERVVLYFVTTDGAIEAVAAEATDKTYKVPPLRVTGYTTRLYRDRIAAGMVPGHGYVASVSPVSEEDAVKQAVARMAGIVRRARNELALVELHQEVVNRLASEKGWMPDA